MKKIIALVLLVAVILPTYSASAYLSTDFRDYINVDYQKYFKNIDTNMAELKGVHPRVLCSEDDFERIRGYAQNEYKDLWEQIVKTADSFIAEPIEFYTSGENTWMSTQGRKLVFLIFTYKISGDKKYKEVIDKTIDEICEYPSWSNKATAGNIHLAGSHNWAAFGLYYDWCYDEIDPERRKRMVENVARRVEDYNTEKNYGFDSQVAHNISLTICGGVIPALAAMYEEIPNAERYMKRLVAEIATVTMEVMPDDGALFEAITYSAHSWQAITTVALIARDILNVDLFSHPTFDAVGKFMTYAHLPVNGWDSGSDVFGWADGTASSAGSMLPALSIIAKEKQNPVYKYFLEKWIERAIRKNVKSEYFFYTLMFADAELEAKSPAEFQDNKNGDIYYPLDFVTSDTGYVFLRDGWDGNEAALEFHCGPVMGKTAVDYRKVHDKSLGIGHQHPDMGSLLLFAEGEWIFQDDGYTTGSTGNHNCLMINGIGQRSDKSTNAHPTKLFGLNMSQAATLMEPKIIKTEFSDDMAYVVCDLTDAYPDYNYYELNTKLEKYYRHYIYLKPKKTILVVDEIETFEESDFEIRWRPDVQIASLQIDGSYMYTGKNHTMRLEGFKLEDTVDITNSHIEVVSGKSGGTKEAYIMQIKNRAEEWVQATAISWENINNSAPVNTALKEENGIYIFSLDDGILKLDLKEQKIETVKSDSGINLKVNDNIIFPEDGVISKEYTTYLSVDEIVELLGLEMENNIIRNKENSVGINKLSKVFTEEEKTYASIREVCEALKICLWWESDSNCVNIDTDADISEAEVYSLAVNGNAVVPDEEGNYSVELFSDNIIIDVTTTVQGTTVEKEMTESGFGENRVKITSQDGMNSKEFSVTVNPKRTKGKYPVYNIVSEGTVTDMKNLLDGNFNTAWAIQGAGPEVVFDLGDVVDLNSVSVAMLHGATRQQIFAIYISEDGKEYKEMFNGKASGKTTEFETYPINANARFVKLVLGGHTNGGGWNNTSEIKFD